MKKQNLYLSSIAPDAPQIAKQYDLGIELAQFCTAAFLDPPKTCFLKIDESLSCFLQRSLDDCLAATSRFLLHGPFNELTPAAIDPLVVDITEKRYRQAIEKAVTLGCKTLVCTRALCRWSTIRSGFSRGRSNSGKSSLQMFLPRSRCVWKTSWSRSRRCCWISSAR